MANNDLPYTICATNIQSINSCNSALSSWLRRYGGPNGALALDMYLTNYEPLSGAVYLRLPTSVLQVMGSSYMFPSDEGIITSDLDLVLHINECYFSYNISPIADFIVDDSAFFGISSSPRCAEKAAPALTLNKTIVLPSEETIRLTSINADLGFSGMAVEYAYAVDSTVTPTISSTIWEESIKEPGVWIAKSKGDALMFIGLHLPATTLYTGNWVGPRFTSEYRGITQSLAICALQECKDSQCARSLAKAVYQARSNSATSWFCLPGDAEQNKDSIYIDTCPTWGCGVVNNQILCCDYVYTYSEGGNPPNWSNDPGNFQICYKAGFAVDTDSCQTYDINSCGA